MKNSQQLEEYRERNKNVTARMRATGLRDFAYYRKVKFQNDLKKALEVFRRQVQLGRVWDEKLEREQVIEKHATANPTPEFIANYGHTSIALYKGHGDTFDLGKFYYKKKENNKVLEKSKCEFYSSQFELKAIPGLIHALQEVYAFALNKLVQEGKEPDLCADYPKNPCPVEEETLVAPKHLLQPAVPAVYNQFNDQQFNDQQFNDQQFINEQQFFQ